MFCKGEGAEPRLVSSNVRADVLQNVWSVECLLTSWLNIEFDYSRLFDLGGLWAFDLWWMWANVIVIIVNEKNLTYFLFVFFSFLDTFQISVWFVLQEVLWIRGYVVVLLKVRMFHVKGVSKIKVFRIFFLSKKVVSYANPTNLSRTYQNLTDK